MYTEESKDKFCYIRHVQTYIQVYANLTSTEPIKNICRKLLVGKRVILLEESS